MERDAQIQAQEALDVKIHDTISQAIGMLQDTESTRSAKIVLNKMVDNSTFSPEHISMLMGMLTKGNRHAGALLVKLASTNIHKNSIKDSIVAYNSFAMAAFNDGIPTLLKLLEDPGKHTNLHLASIELLFLVVTHAKENLKTLSEIDNSINILTNVSAHWKEYTNTKECAHELLKLLQ